MTGISISVPAALLVDAVGQDVTIKLINGDEYRGKLAKADGGSSLLGGVHLSAVLYRRHDGYCDAQADVFIPGNQIKYYNLPDAMKDAAFFSELRGGGNGSGEGGAGENNKKGKI